jgi:hypothetical protein
VRSWECAAKKPEVITTSPHTMASPKAARTVCLTWLADRGPAEPAAAFR